MENVYVLTSATYSEPISLDSKPFITNEGAFSSLKKGKEWLKNEVNKGDEGFGEGGILQQTGMFDYILKFEGNDECMVFFSFKRWNIDQPFP